MSKRLKVNLLKYGISALVCGGMAWLYVYLRDFSAESTMEQYRILCDAFTIPGLTALMVALLLTLSNEGALDGLGYVASIAVKSLTPGGRKKHEKYYDYVQRKHANKLTGYGFLYIVGAVCMAVAMVFMALFYQLHG